jgi:uncharacterized protein YndB with AHSA1/START domain
MSDTDRIEKTILLRAPRARVWRALTDPDEFGSWFRVRLECGFAVGRSTTGNITHPGYEHVRFEATVERMDDGRLFSFRWHPYAVDPRIDYSQEPTTLVEFRLTDHPEGTMLSVVESGFDGIPPHRRRDAFLRNSEGWVAQLESLGRHVAG